MKFRDLYNKYKILVFVLYALPLTVALIFLEPLLLKILLALPLLALGGFILFEIFPRKGDGYISSVHADGKGEVHVVYRAVIRAVRTACKEIKDIRYKSCTVSGGGNEGATIRLCIKVVNTKVLEVSDLTREFVKELVEGELNLKISKIDIVVVNTTYVLTVKRVEKEAEENRVPERKAVYTEDSPSYILRYGSSHKVFKVPSNYIEEGAGAAQKEPERLAVAETAAERVIQDKKPEIIKTEEEYKAEAPAEEREAEEPEAKEAEAETGAAIEGGAIEDGAIEDEIIEDETDEEEEETENASEPVESAAIKVTTEQDKFAEWLAKQEQLKQANTSLEANAEEKK